jgi:hypothetical protein
MVLPTMVSHLIEQALLQHVGGVDNACVMHVPKSCFPAGRGVFGNALLCAS